MAQANRIPESQLPAPFTVPFSVPPVLAPVRSTADADYYVITQKAVAVEVLPGLQTVIWGYEGMAPGPTISASRGRRAIVRQINALPAFHPTLRYKPYTSTHLHSSPSLPEFDGYASDITSPGEWKDYVYPNTQEARTLWYHDHGVNITGPNAYMGLAAMYLLHDDLESSLHLPRGRYDVPLMIKDALFESSGALIFDDHSESGMFGDVILVNGRPWPLMAVEQRKYRFRILNASVARSYELALDTGDPFTVIATEGGLMPAPQQAASMRVGMAERFEVVIDFAQYKTGQRIVLKNLGPDNNIDFATTGSVMAFQVGGPPTDKTDNVVPAILNPNNPAMKLTAGDAKLTRRFAFERKHGEWTINGQTWNDVVNSGFTATLAHPGLGDVEIWELENRSGGWFHPVHVHLIDGKILDRNGQPPFSYERGPKDTFYVGENETVRVVMRFGPQVGRYMMHCHNLVHEDHDMMHQFEVGTGGHDPIRAAPARRLPAPQL